MNHIYIFILFLLIILPIFYQNIEHFYTQCPNTHPTKLADLDHLLPREYTFTPYHMENTIDVSKRGCETSKYWDCVINHPRNKEYEDVSTIPDKVNEECKKHSDSVCQFPERISHSRSEPYYQYLDYI